MVGLQTSSECNCLQYFDSKNSVHMHTHTCCPSYFNDVNVAILGITALLSCELLFAALPSLINL